ncbi:MAG: 16S rRNA (adenine(1518)-N(6)/adenine(1519)-N(6))-dimethyltransferase RsmA [Polyangiaceae bacterium]
MKSAVQLLRERGLRAKKSLGQNFLLDGNVCERIANAAVPIGSGGHALEIGPGLGALTRPLLERAERVVAIERDADLAAVLREELAEPVSAGRLEIKDGDALEVDWRAVLDGAPGVRWSLVGNLPYLITGRLVESAIRVADRVERAVFMVQAEVADRIVSPAGGDAYGALSVFTQAAFRAEKLLTVKGGAFHPRPEVDSTVVVLTPLTPCAAVEDEAFQKVVKAAFQARRKTLRNAWRGLFDASALADLSARTGIDLGRRGETLGVAEFDAAAAVLRAAAS